jgi:hypothetical protein
LRCCVLLTSTSLVVANLDQEALDVYEIDVTNKSLNFVQKLLLPKVTGDGSIYLDALLRSHPNPLSHRTTQTPLGPAAAHTQLPFTTDETDGIIVCTFQTGKFTFTLITHRSSLIHPYNMDASPRTTDQGHVFRLVPWSDWGPSNCRLLKAQNSKIWIFYVHGHRFVTLEPRTIEHEKHPRFIHDLEREDTPFVKKALSAIRQRIDRVIRRKETATTSDDGLGLVPEEDSEEEELTPGSTWFYALRVFDFNPRNIRTATASGIPTIKPDALSKERVKKGQLLVEEPSLLRFLSDRMPTALPYLETTVRLKDIGLDGKNKIIGGVMMNGECVIFMTVRRMIVICPCADPHLNDLQTDRLVNVRRAEIRNL